MMYIFFAILLVLASVVAMPDDLLLLVKLCMAVTAWSMIFFGVWVILASIVQVFYSKVFAIEPIVSTLLRIALCLLLAFLLDVGNSLIEKGFSI